MENKTRAIKQIKKKSFYITTTIPYVNAKPHIGFALEIIQADVIARYKRLLNYEVFFNFGVDEHGQKILEKAQELKITPQEYTDSLIESFTRLKEKLNLSYDAFLRTTSEKHKKAAQEMWRLCQKRGDIYKKNYKIKYCVGCELEKTNSELENEKCPLHPNKELEIRNEENYFFALSKYQDALLKIYAEKDFVIPDYRLNEIRSLIQEKGLQDFSISRLKKKMSWGVKVPNDDEHVMYVWFDAFNNYISTLNWPEEKEKFNKFWNGSKNCLQMAGKDQVRQQAVMWQAMLMSAGLPPTGQIFIHGFINSGGVKMSKSIGNVIDPIEIVDKYGIDALRYFLLRHIHPTEDSDFTEKRFQEAYTADLVNGLGNLTNRILTMSAQANLKNSEKINVFEKEKTFLENFEFNKELNNIWKNITHLDEVITREEPYKKIKSLDENKIVLAQELILSLLKSLAEIANSLKPILPDTSEKIFQALQKNKKPEHPLFPRI